MIKVRKGDSSTEILEVHKVKYISLGWHVVEMIGEKPLTGDAEIIANGINAKKAAQERVRGATSTTTEAKLIAATEIAPRRKGAFTDGLIKE